METDNTVNDNEMGGLSILAQGVGDPGNLAVQGGVYTDIIGSNTIGGTMTVKNKIILDPSITVGIDAGDTSIINVSDPISSNDAANKNYIDTLKNTSSNKETVTAATTIAGTLSSSFIGGSTIDGIILVTGQRILIKNQTNPVENGVYIVSSSGTPTRSLDFASGIRVSGASIFVKQGTTLANTLWICSSVYPNDVVGTNDILFTYLFTKELTAGTGLTKTGLELSVNSSQPGITSVGTLTSLTVSGQITSTVSTGTAPLIVNSSTAVGNLNASFLGGATFASPTSIGSTTPNTGKFTYININGSTSGTIGIGNTTGNYNLSLPSTLGITGQNLVLSDNSGSLKWGLPITWVISDQKSSGTTSGTFTSGAWRTRTLNTIISSSSSSDVTLSSNQISMTAGTYSIQIVTPAYSAGSHACRLFNVSNSTVVDVGTSEFSGGLLNAIQSSSSLYTTFSISSTTVFSIQHQCTTTSTTNGFGLQTGLQTEVYALCKLTKLI